MHSQQRTLFYEGCLDVASRVLQLASDSKVYDMRAKRNHWWYHHCEYLTHLRSTSLQRVTGCDVSDAKSTKQWSAAGTDVLQ